MNILQTKAMEIEDQQLLTCKYTGHIFKDTSLLSIVILVLLLITYRIMMKITSVSDANSNSVI